jgi:hypothetical protein
LSRLPDDRVPTRRRVLVIGLILLLLALAGFANATIKGHRAAAVATSTAAVSAASADGNATSSAWYCAGPLPLGLRTEHSRVAIANISDKTVHGELVVATESGVSRAEHLAVPPRAALSLALRSPEHSAFGAATVLLDAAGAGVEELVTGPTGTDASPCVDHAGSVQYLSGGGTKGAAVFDLAIFDPGATPSVASVSFATANGVVSPPAFQQMPIEAGETLVLDVARELPLQPLLATTVTAAGGRVVAGALASETVGATSFPSLVAATSVPQSTWSFGPNPSGPNARQGFVVLNPGAGPARVTLHSVGSSGHALFAATVPSGGVVELAPPPDKLTSGSSWATVSSTQPVVVARETVLAANGAAKPPAGTTATKVAAPPSGFPVRLPSGFALTPGSPVLERSWLVVGAQADVHDSALITIANPSDTTVTVRLLPLSTALAPQSVVVGPLGSVVVNLTPTAPGPAEVAAELQASAPIVVGTALYGSGVKGSLGFSAPGAIPVD